MVQTVRSEWINPLFFSLSQLYPFSSVHITYSTSLSYPSFTKVVMARYPDQIHQHLGTFPSFLVYCFLGCMQLASAFINITCLLWHVLPQWIDVCRDCIDHGAGANTPVVMPRLNPKLAPRLNAVEKSSGVQLVARLSSSSPATIEPAAASHGVNSQPQPWKISTNDGFSSTTCSLDNVSWVPQLALALKGYTHTHTHICMYIYKSLCSSFQVWCAKVK